MDAIKNFADHVACTGYEDLSPQAIDATRMFIQDSLGVGLVGSAAPQVDELRRRAALWGGAMTPVYGFPANACRHLRQLSSMRF